MTTKVAYAILTILLGAVIINSALIARTADEMYAMAADEGLELGEKAARLKKAFYEKELFISLSVSHEDLENVEDLIAEMNGAVSAGDEEAALIAKSRLENALLHLGRLSSVNWESIF